MKRLYGSFLARLIAVLGILSIATSSSMLYAQPSTTFQTTAGITVHLPLLTAATPSDGSLATAVETMDPFVTFDGMEYTLDPAFDPQAAGIDQGAYTMLRTQLDQTNAALANDTALQRQHQEARALVSLQASCNRSSGIIETWYGFKIYLNSGEATDVSIRFGRASLGVAGSGLLGAKWIQRLNPIIGNPIAALSAFFGLYAQAFSEGNKNNCGVVAYHNGMNPNPFWIWSQLDE